MNIPGTLQQQPQSHQPSLNTLKSTIHANKSLSLQQKTCEQVEKWRSELLYLDSSNIKIQEAIVIQNVIETALCKSIPLFNEIHEKLNKLLLLETKLFDAFISLLQSISQLHDRQQTMTKLLLLNWKFTSPSSNSNCTENENNIYGTMKQYYFPELGNTEQKLEISIPNFEIMNPILTLVNLILDINFMDQYFMITTIPTISTPLLTTPTLPSLSTQTIKFLGALVSKNQKVRIEHLFYDENSFDVLPKTKFIFSSSSLDKKIFNSLYFYNSTSSFSEKPFLYQFQKEYTIHLSSDNNYIVIINWLLDEKKGYEEVINLFPLTNFINIISSIGGNSFIGTNSSVGTSSSIGHNDSTNLDFTCDLYYYSKVIYEWKYILPVVLVSYNINDSLIKPYSFILTSFDSTTFNFTFKIDDFDCHNNKHHRLHSSSLSPSSSSSTFPSPSFFKIINYKLTINEAWLTLVKNLSECYSNVIKKFNLNLIKTKRDYSSIQFIAEMVTAQRKIKETNIELFTSLNR